VHYRLAKLALGIAAVAAFSTGTSWAQNNPAPQAAQQESPYKDQGEYDLRHRGDEGNRSPQQIEKLKEWEQKIPDSKLKATRTLTQANALMKDCDGPPMERRGRQICSMRGQSPRSRSSTIWIRIFPARTSSRSRPPTISGSKPKPASKIPAQTCWDGSPFKRRTTKGRGHIQEAARYQSQRMRRVRTTWAAPSSRRRMCSDTPRPCMTSRTALSVTGATALPGAPAASRRSVSDQGFTPDTTATI